ncbi:MAG: TetR/AcrR family transcriptional regulator [Chloroflexota bacterium]
MAKRNGDHVADTETPVEMWHGSLHEHRLRQSDHIAHAAMGIITKDGMAGLSMSAIADASGMSRQTLYKYFPDLESVLLGMAGAAGAMDAQLAERIESEADPARALSIVVESVLTAAAAGHPSPIALETTLPPGARADLQEHEDRTEALVVGLVRRGLEAGSFKADLDPELDGRIVYRTMLAVHDLAAEPGTDLDRLTVHVTGAVMRIVGVE